MAHFPTTQQADPNGRVEQDKVDSGLHVVDLSIVLGVQAIVPAHGHVSHAASPVQHYRSKICHPGAEELGQHRKRAGRGPQHGIEQMRTSQRRAENASKEDALVDLMPFLAGLRARSLGRQLVCRGYKAGKGGRGRCHQLCEPEADHAAIGELAVDGIGVSLHELAAKRTHGFLCRRRGSALILRTLAWFLQRREQLVGARCRLGQGSPIQGQVTAYDLSLDCGPYPSSRPCHRVTPAESLRSSRSQAAR
jgi:hypothetical protein